MVGKHNGLCKQQSRHFVWSLSSLLSMLLLISRFAWIVFLLRATFINSKCGSSHFPSEGQWTDYPPFWTPKGCSVVHPDQASMIRCLGNRTIFALGTSIARQFPFEIARRLGAPEVSRNEQLHSCTHHSMNWDCINGTMGVNFRYRYAQYLDGFDYSKRGGFTFIRPTFQLHDSAWDVAASKRKRKSVGFWTWETSTPRPSPAPVVTARPTSEVEKQSVTYLHSIKLNPKEIIKCKLPKGQLCSPQQAQKLPLPEDTCWRQTAYDGLKPFFVGAKSSDIFILTAGLHYALFRTEDTAVDYDAWLTESAINFQNAVNKLFPGRVFRVTLSAMRNNDNTMSYESSYMYHTERLLSKVFQENNDPSHPWFTIDQWSINKGREHLYNDHIHYIGNLTDATINNIVSELCYS